MAIELRDISKRYGDKQVLENINLTLEEGISCIMGPSGRGKTTLAYIIAGLVLADSGSIEGCEGKRSAFMFQEDRLLEWESAIRNVLFVCKSARKNYKKAHQLLVEAGLADSINVKASKLSGGMKRRVCLCRALIADYEILILDEPFKGLDSGIKPALMKMVQDYVLNSAGKTVICITHDPAEAEFLGGRLISFSSAP